ncbi:hypothetical protein SAMN05192551_10814 [Tindallia magadiensis]|uniref:Uncharacterized protein n=1 Tax=Tindallia magadiensis TaxID=69895 RepID=A0A1I3G5C0_9FIRM|nr:hypothetical protein [Tindallia magadiensis]SFI18680.1 hypothetical protein SAMN05192551_10814 [Tindallia magadiensis]
MIDALKGKNRNNPSNNFLSLLKYLGDEFVDKKIIDPANTNNIIAEDLYKYEKRAIQEKARESRSQK